MLRGPVGSGSPNIQWPPILQPKYPSLLGTVTTNLDPPKLVLPGPYFSKYLDPPEHLFQHNVEIYGPPLEFLFPPFTKSPKFEQVYRIVFTKGGLATTDLRLAEV